jgi:hypothetical protein
VSPFLDLAAVQASPVLVALAPSHGPVWLKIVLGVMLGVAIVSAIVGIILRR